MKQPNRSVRTFKLPWEKDPDDREANYRKPIPRRELIRLYAKAALVVAAGMWFKFASETRSHEGAKLSLALGAALVGAGLVDLFFLRRHEIEQIFLTSRRQQIAVRAVVLLAGLALLVAGGLAYSR